jgi:hypothetical protein
MLLVLSLLLIHVLCYYFALISKFIFASVIDKLKPRVILIKILSTYASNSHFNIDHTLLYLP